MQRFDCRQFATITDYCQISSVRGLLADDWRTGQRYRRRSPKGPKLSSTFCYLVAVRLSVFAIWPRETKHTGKRKSIAQVDLNVGQRVGRIAVRPLPGCPSARAPVNSCRDRPKRKSRREHLGASGAGRHNCAPKGQRSFCPRYREMDPSRSRADIMIAIGGTAAIDSTLTRNL